MDQPTGRRSKLVSDFLEGRDILFAYIWALTRDFLVAEEIFQEVALAILDEANRGVQVRSFDAWAREISRRRVAEYFRKRSRRDQIERLSGSMVEVVGQCFQELELTAEQHALRQTYLMACLARMSGRMREVIDRRYRDRLSLQTIAEKLSWKVASVKVTLSRARKALADCIQGRIRQVS